MSFNKQDNRDMSKHLENNGWTKNKNSDGYSKDGKSLHQSESGGRWTGTAGTFTDLSTAKNSNRTK